MRNTVTKNNKLNYSSLNFGFTSKPLSRETILGTRASLLNPRLELISMRYYYELFRSLNLTNIKFINSFLNLA